MFAWRSAPEILTNAEMAQADSLTIAAGTPGWTLMQRAGAAVAAAAQALVPQGARIAVLCGPGNNGGDGFVAASALARSGFSIDLALLGRRESLRGDAALAAAGWPGVILSAGDIALDAADLVIDALFGAGLARDLDGEAADLVARINAWSSVTGRPVLAVDVPSGVDGTSGDVRGAAVRATRTISFFRAKPGHFLLPGRILCGVVEIADIGIAPDVLSTIGPTLRVNAPALWLGQFPAPRRDGHKYSRGHCLVVSGPAIRTGAARLSARAALRIGAGLVTLAADDAALPIAAAHLTAIMLEACNGPADLARLLADPRKSSVVLGPALGVGEVTRNLVRVALAPAPDGHKSRRAFVLDADALTSFSGALAELTGLVAQAPGPVVLTPHEGEFARLFGSSITGDLSKIARARAAAAISGALVVLKGADTVVAAPDGRACVSARDAPFLATAGSGDVLAGFVGGLLAQGMPAFEAASAAVWLHAEIGARLAAGLIAEDLPEAIPALLRDLLPTPA